MPETYEMEVTREFDICVTYTMTRGLRPITDIYHPDAEPPEPDVVELDSVTIGGAEILKGLTEQEIKELVTECEMDVEQQEQDNDTTM